VCALWCATAFSPCNLLTWSRTHASACWSRSATCAIFHSNCLMARCRFCAAARAALTSAELQHPGFVKMALQHHYPLRHLNTAELPFCNLDSYLSKVQCRLGTTTQTRLYLAPHAFCRTCQLHSLHRTQTASVEMPDASCNDCMQQKHGLKCRVHLVIGAQQPHIFGGC
jgi:hypothetical protein